MSDAPKNGFRIPIKAPTFAPGTVDLEAIRKEGIDPADLVTIGQIIRRAADMMKQATGRTISAETDALDLILCHKMHCPLKLTQLLLTSDSDFADDYVGIHNNWNRREFVLMNGFWPRCAAKPKP